MSVSAGEEIAGMWAAPALPQAGAYKLVAKKRVDGQYEWAHFIHRPDGTRKLLFRGEVESLARLTDVLDAANRQLQHLFGVTMSMAEANMKTLDGRSADDRVQ